MQTLKEQDWECAHQASVLANVAQAFESDESVSDDEGDRVTLFSLATQLSLSGQGNAETLTVMLQEQLDAINEEIWSVIPYSAPWKLGFSEELPPPREILVFHVRNLSSGLLEEFSVLRLPLIIELGQPGGSVQGILGCPPSALSPKVGEVPRRCPLRPKHPPVSSEPTNFW